MTATAQDTRKMRFVSEAGELRFYSYERGKPGLHYATWDEMSENERAWYCKKWPEFRPPDGLLSQESRVQDVPATSPTAPAAVSPAPDLRHPAYRYKEQLEYHAAQAVNRYAGKIEWYRGKMAVLDSIIKDPRESPNLRGRAASDIDQFREAIEMLEDAALIPESEVAWFVTNMGEFQIHIPPVVEGEYDRMLHKISSSDHYYFAKNPVEIATLRRAAKKNGSTIFEKPEGTFPIIDYANSSFEGWGGSELYMARQSKRYKPL